MPKLVKGLDLVKKITMCRNKDSYGLVRVLMIDNKEAQGGKGMQGSGGKLSFSKKE